MEELIKEIFYKEKSKEEGIDVRIKFNLGKLDILPFSGDRLYELNAEYPNENYTPNVKYSVSNIGILNLESQNVTSTLGTSIKIENITNVFNKEKRDDTIHHIRNKWDLKINKDIPAELSLTCGASEQNIELGGMSLKYLKLSTGASATVLNFSEPNKERQNIKLEAGASSLEAKGLGNANAESINFKGGVGKSLLNFSGELKENSLIEISGGMGLIDLEIPKDTGAKIEASGNKFITLTLQNIPDNFKKTGGVYLNNAYDENKPHLTIKVNMAIGSLNIKEI